MLEGIINIFDIIGAIFLVTIIILFSNIYKNTKLKAKPEYKYFTYGLITKIVGSVALALIYVFYYKGGDTIYYFLGGETLTNAFFASPSDYFKLLFKESNEFTLDLQSITNRINYYRSPEEWFMVRVTSILVFFSFNRYLITSIFVSIISFYGSWKLFKAFLYFFPNYQKAAFISIFLLPSVMFWGSGILKDTITFAALGVFFYHFVEILFKNRVSLSSILIMFISIIIIFKLKAYIIIGFLPAIIIAIYISKKNQITNNLIRRIFAPFFLIIMISVGYFLIINLVNQNNKYQISNLESRVKGFHSWHTTTGGSSYNLGKVEYTLIGIIKKIPESLNVTFFRPYLWEARNITSFVGAVESFVLTLLFLFIMWKYKFRWIRFSLKNSFLTLAMVYSIVFGFAVGFTSYNFGALARYKIPVMPFFSFWLLYFYYKYRFVSLRNKVKNAK